MFSWYGVWNVIRPFLKMACILLIGHYVILYLLKLAKRAFLKTEFDESLVKFLMKTMKIVLYMVVILSALNAIGISTTGLLAAFSAAAVAVAVALKDSLSNVAGGILLLISPRFVTGDYISAGGDEGTVLSVDLLHTTVRTPDSRQVSIPNGVLINNHIINFSQEQTRRVDITFPVSYKSDIEHVKRVAKEKIMAHPLVLTEPEEPFVRVHSYGDSAVNLVTRTWCRIEDYWTVYFDLVEQVRAAFVENDIEIPFNQLDVHMSNEE